MSKILISSIGTGNIKKDSDEDYFDTKYIIDGKEYEDSLTAKVLIHHYNIDKVYFIGTNRSMWDNIYYYFNGKDDEFLDYLSSKKEAGIEKNDLSKIEKSLDEYLGSSKPSSKCLLIEYKENSNEEIWNNFEKLLAISDQLEDGDEIYLDITHGFRYMPILNIFLLEFLTLLNSNNIKIAGVFYGMYSENRSNIIDFKIFFDLLDWAKALSMLKNSSNALPLAMLLAKDSENHEYEKIFLQFGNNLQIANMASLWQFIKNANKKIKKLENSDNKIIRLISKKIYEIVNRLDKDTQSKFQYELAVWLYENKNYALSYIALHEAIVTKACETKGYSVSDIKEREEAKKHIDAPYNKYFNTKYQNSISQIRNNIAHQSMDRKNMVEQDIKKLVEFLEDFKSYFYQI